MGEMRIGDKIIGPGKAPFIIAEIGVNYENDMSVAERMIVEAAQAGAHAVKFQSYKADRLAAGDSPAYWSERKTQREFFKLYDSFGPQEYRHLAAVAEQSGVVFLSTPFDKEAVDYLDPLVPAFKVASADITNVDLLRRIAAKGKPVLLSTGASTLSEIASAVEFLHEQGVNEMALLHCILHYPTSYNEANLRSIHFLGAAFPDCVIGYSDHTKPDRGMALLTSAVLLGASVVEKHFTLDKSKPGNDHYHAMDPSDLKCLTANLEIVREALGRETREVLESELPARRFARRSIVSAERIPKGARVGPEHLVCKRPCTGIDARLFDLVIGRTARIDIEEDTILQWDMLV